MAFYLINATKKSMKKFAITFDPNAILQIPVMSKFMLYSDIQTLFEWTPMEFTFW